LSGYRDGDCLALSPRGDARSVSSPVLQWPSDEEGQVIMDRPVTSSLHLHRVRPSRYQAAMIKGQGKDERGVTERKEGRTHNARAMGHPTTASGADAPLGTIQPEQLMREGPVEITSEGPPLP